MSGTGDERGGEGEEEGEGEGEGEDWRKVRQRTRAEVTEWASQKTESHEGSELRPRMLGGDARQSEARGARLGG